MYRRWHGAGLLSLSYLGYLALADPRGESGAAALRVCACFRTLASLVGFVALGDGDDGRWSSTKALLDPHNGLTVGFALLLQPRVHQINLAWYF